MLCAMAEQMQQHRAQDHRAARERRRAGPLALNERLQTGLSTGSSTVTMEASSALTYRMPAVYRM